MNGPGSWSYPHRIAMGKLEMLQWGSNQLRVGPWRGDATVAQVVPAPGQRIAPDAVEHTLRDLADQGYRTVLTPALTETDQAPFLLNGFAVHERLHLLRRGLLTAVPPDLTPTVAHRRGRRRDRPAVLRVDRAAFAPFWQFDEQGLVDARSATPTSRFRVVADDDVIGYAITGRGGGIAYLQRLAVMPRCEGRGIGTTLVLDAFRWAMRHSCSSMLVNTQETNVRAVRLYEQLGFAREPVGLAVLRRDLDPNERPDTRARP